MPHGAAPRLHRPGAQPSWHPSAALLDPSAPALSLHTAPIPPIRYGSKSLRGTEVAALFYSLIETARLRGEDPGRYLLRAALAAIENPGTVSLPACSD
ncbi:hypothetical protein [Cystobacter fuscus]|uniref:hypothetical protein n=1 Tax=Cystobacter fuscus TaxID=43 RepID=UPI0012DC4A4C|nr:hypothetical protein [Cystobacter fuscus]